MLNPSTADGGRDDPTIARCRRRAERLGFPALEVANLFALRTTDPRILYGAESPVGPRNERHLRALAREAGLVICAWGNHGRLHGRGRAMLALLARAGVTPHALALTGAGAPAHPLYLPMAARPFTWSATTGALPGSAPQAARR